MPAFVMLTRLTPDRLDSPQTMEDLEHDAMAHIRATCPEVEWLQSYAVLGSYDYVDIFNAPDNETATKVSTLIRTYGRAHPEVLPATDWGKFKEILHSLPTH